MKKFDSEAGMHAQGEASMDEAHLNTGVVNKSRERRFNDRAALEAEVGIYSDSNFYAGFSQDISEGGIFVATWDLQPIGTKVDVTFTLPGNHELKVSGVVRWIRDPNDKFSETTPGMGVRFIDVPDDQHRLIKEFVSQRPPLFYDDEDL